MIPHVSARTRGLLWALVLSPVISWVAALSAQMATHGRIGPLGVVIFLVILPALLAARITSSWDEVPWWRGCWRSGSVGPGSLRLHLGGPANTLTPSTGLRNAIAEDPEDNEGAGGRHVLPALRREELEAQPRAQQYT
jgi:hypothetical protein